MTEALVTQVRKNTDGKVEKCMKEIAYLTDLLQMKVEGEVRPVPVAATPLSVPDKKTIKSINDYWFGAAE